MLTIRENYDRLNVSEIIEGFNTALIWQDENLNECSDVEMSYGAREKCTHTVKSFLAVCCLDEQAIDQILQHGQKQTGHDIALQMLGHGVGFWEQKSTDKLNQIMDFCLDKGVIKGFTLYMDHNANRLEWDGI